jgi:hypothetical protein
MLKSLAAIAQESLVDFPSKRDNIRLRQRNAHVTEVSPTRISRPRQRRRAPKAIHRKAGQERNLRPARPADAGHAYGFALRAMRHSADFDNRTHRKMSEVRLRTPLLPPVYVLRYLEPLRMHPTHPRADPAQGRAQSMYVLFHARPGRKGNLHPKFSPSHGCPNGIRESLQEVNRVARTLCPRVAASNQTRPILNDSYRPVATVIPPSLGASAPDVLRPARTN